MKEYSDKQLMGIIEVEDISVDFILFTSNWSYQPKGDLSTVFGETITKLIDWGNLDKLNLAWANVRLEPEVLLCNVWSVISCNWVYLVLH